MTQHVPMLADLVIIVGVSLPVLFVFRKIGLPPIAGFVMTGVLIGPYGLKWITSVENVEAAAEIGVILLLFAVGLEFSLSRLMKTPGRMWMLAIGQVLLTAAVGVLISLAIGLPVAAAVVVGFVLALSSSAIVLKGLSEMGELETPVGRMVVLICLVQDIAIVPMLFVVGFLVTGDTSIDKIVQAAWPVIVLVGGVYLAARWIIPRLMKLVVKIRAAEVVLLITIVVLLGTVWITSFIGLSLALGAFAAGLLLSETEYQPQIFSEVIPFRTLFSSLFFVSIGMLVDVGFVSRHWLPVLTVAVGVILVKTIAVYLVSLPLHVPTRQGLTGGFYLAQIGEFSFLIIGVATAGQLISQEIFQYLIASASLSLAVTPVVMQFAPHIVTRAEHRLPFADKGKPEAVSPTTARPQPAVLIIGFGLNGRNVSRVLREAGIYHEILESNPEVVRTAREEGELVHLGEATRYNTLRHFEVDDFDSVVMAISDPAATRHALSLIRKLNPRAHIIARTRYVSEVEDLEKLGADVVVPEEFETSLRIFSELLTHYRVPPHVVNMQVEVARGKSYSVLRETADTDMIENLQSLIEARLVETIPVMPTSHLIGQTVRNLNLESEEGCMLISLMRKGRPLRPPFANYVIEEGDLMVLYGDHASLDQAVKELRAST